MLFALGLMSNYLFQPEAGSLSLIKSVFYALLPNWQVFWLADALATRKTIPLAYLGYAAIYVLLYIGLCSMWAVLVFRDKEIAKDSR